MPHSLSAKKRLRQNEVRRAKNRAVKRTLRTLVRKVREAVEGGNLQQSETEFRQAVVRLDRAASHGTIHPNAAARTKSRLSARVKALKAKAK
ncbi:MAG: 30S ribosomal protein S20 [Pirellulales bacterium]